MRQEHIIIRNSSGGFSLIELSIVLTVISLLFVPGLKMYQTMQNQSRLAENQQRIAAVQQGLSIFMSRYERLPCPASFIAQPGDANYGREVMPLCLQQDGKMYVPDGKATFAATGRSTPVQKPPMNADIIIGAVPVRDLGLPDNMRTDVYGHLFTYAVSATETKNLNDGAGIIDVVDATGHTVLPYAFDKTSAGTALYVLVDHGKDGKGAYSDNAGPAVTRPAIPCAAPGLDKLNCSFENGPATPFAFRSAPYGIRPGESWFDDTIVFYTPMSADAPAVNTANSTCQAVTTCNINDFLLGKQLSDLVQKQLNSALQAQQGHLQSQAQPKQQQTPQPNQEQQPSLDPQQLQQLQGQLKSMMQDINGQ